MPEPSTGRQRPDASLSHHILPSAATMVGLCPTLIGLVKLTETDGVVRHVDEYIGIITVLFVISALASYASIRNPADEQRGQAFERTADLFFIVGLVGLAAVSLLFAYELV